MWPFSTLLGGRARTNQGGLAGQFNFLLFIFYFFPRGPTATGLSSSYRLFRLRCIQTRKQPSVKNKFIADEVAAQTEDAEKTRGDETRPRQQRVVQREREREKPTICYVVIYSPASRRSRRLWQMREGVTMVTETLKCMCALWIFFFFFFNNNCNAVIFSFICAFKSANPCLQLAANGKVGLCGCINPLH